MKKCERDVRGMENNTNKPNVGEAYTPTSEEVAAYFERVFAIDYYVTHLFGGDLYQKNLPES